jgi:hypothetical protein
MNVFRRSGIWAGETVAIVGVGFLGALLVQLAADAGARVIALSRRSWALDRVRALGASETLVMDEPGHVVEQVSNLTGGKFCEVTIEATGAQAPLDLAGELTGVRGRLVIAGYHQDGKRAVNLQQWNWRGFDVINAHERDPKQYVQGIRDAVDALFRHPNTPPFVCRQLIQFLVTDNPSPSYVRRVQDVFVNDGSGQRGNLGAVIKAILLDPEARLQPTSDSFGKVREPVIRTMHMGRLFKLAEAHPDFVWWNWTDTYYGSSKQEPMNSPSVFNFYTPVYQAPGEIRNGGLVSPGFQIVDTFSSISFPNLMWEYLHRGFRSSYEWWYPLDYSATLPLAENPAALVDHVDLLVCAGTMTARTRSILLDAVSDPALAPKERVALAVWTAMTCPEGTVQR